MFSCVHLLVQDIRLSGNSFLRGKMGQRNLVGVVTTLQAGRSRNLISNPDRDERFFPLPK